MIELSFKKTRDESTQSGLNALKDFARPALSASIFGGKIQNIFLDTKFIYKEKHKIYIFAVIVII